MADLVIALNLATNKRGGSERYLEEVAARCQRWGIELRLILTRCAPDVRAAFEARGVDVVEIGAAPPLLRAARVAAAARGARAVVLQFFPLVDPVVAALRVAGVSRVIYVDDHSGAPARRAPHRELAARAAHRGIALALHRVVAVSDFVARRLVDSSHMRDHEVTRVYNGVCSPRPLEPRERRDLRRSLGVRHDQTFVVGVGNLIPEKGFDTLLDACARSEANIAVRLAGEGPERDRLAALAGDESILLGRRNDVPELMSAADIVAVPSRWAEAFGFTVAEGMRAARPVVASRVGGIPELIRDGHTGVLVDVDDLAGWVRALDELAGSPARRRTLGDAARQDASERFSVQRMADEMFGVMQEALRDAA
jgi:glycosyltransferase involved in cell wall biosynthesis